MQELSRTQRYYQENKERFRRNKQRHRDRRREWVREQAKLGEKRRYAENPQAKIKGNQRSVQNQVLRGAAGAKTIAKFEAAIGCTVAEFKAHLERQFVDGMTWENRGRDGWHVDHKKPLSSFDLTDPYQFAAAYHYTNTQPLWADANRRKMVS
jgi:hypothetical protein